MQSSYNHWLVALSFGVAVLASYTAFDVSGRISRLNTSDSRWYWLAGGAVSMGVGIWSMHFVGMLAFSLPIPLGYDFAITAYSLAIAIGASFCALYLITHVRLNAVRLALGGTLLGLAIAAMHYTGMAAMQMTPAIQYDTPWFLISIVIAIAAATVAIQVATSLNVHRTQAIGFKRFCAAVILGGAIAGMHYTGMAAAHFQPGSICGAANVVHTNWLAAIVTLLTIGILFVTLMFSSFSSNTSSMLHSLATLNGQVVKLATLDPLTELPNREMLGIRVQKAIEVADARQQIFALLHIDLDGFKSISDPTRHVDGDAALKALATRLRECVRGSDTVARLAGDEFVVLLAGLTNQQEAEARVIPLLTRMQEDLPLRNASLQVNPGIGIALYPADGHDLRTLLKNADAAMLVAKKRGHGGFRFFEASMNEAADRTALVQNAIRDALANGYLRVAYQPKFYANGALSGGEALVRLVHPQHGTIGPAEFIPIAEHSGQIIQIGYWVARETCRQLHLWDLEKLPRTKIAINLSAAQLNQADLVSNMLDIVLSQALTPDRIIFEITETVAMQDAEKSEETIHAFQDSGFDISIDDFGTGYSSLAYLQRFRAKQLKIDRFFTLSLEDAGEEGRVIVSAIISLAHALQMDVVGEGVETEMQLAQLTSLGCDEMQGFFLGKPLGAAEFGQRVLSSKNT